MIGERPTLRLRIQSAIGRTLIMLGFLRLGWDVQTFSLRGHICHQCDRRSRTERVHLTHDCDGRIEQWAKSRGFDA